MSKIEWTEKTWNPVVGCEKISPGCRECYAEKMAGRLANMGQEPYKDVVLFEGSGDDNNPKTKFMGAWNGTTQLVESALDKPLKRKKPTTYFTCSMGDLFHESVPFQWIDKVMAIISMCPQHTFQLLTKRPERMAEYFAREKLNVRIMTELDLIGENNNYCYQAMEIASAIPQNGFWPLENVLLGVTAENQDMADKRIPILLSIPAAKRFVSIEPMLGLVNLTDIDAEMAGHEEYIHINSLTGKHTDMGRPCNPVNKLEHVICGGESGPGARPMNPKWARALRDQCASAGVPFLFKQFGEWVDEFHPLAIPGKCKQSDQFVEIVNTPHGQDYKGVYMYKVGKKKAGRLLDDVLYDQRPE